MACGYWHQPQLESASFPWVYCGAHGGFTVLGWAEAAAAATAAAAAAAAAAGAGGGATTGCPRAGVDTVCRAFRPGDYGFVATADGLDAGQLYFSGRRDQQVKIRGFRIELGEVESAMLTHGGADAAAALAIEQRLVAFVRRRRQSTQLR